MQTLSMNQATANLFLSLLVNYDIHRFSVSRELNGILPPKWMFCVTLLLYGISSY